MTERRPDLSFASMTVDGRPIGRVYSLWEDRPTHYHSSELRSGTLGEMTTVGIRGTIRSQITSIGIRDDGVIHHRTIDGIRIDRSVRVRPPTVDITEELEVSSEELYDLLYRRDYQDEFIDFRRYRVWGSGSGVIESIAHPYPSTRSGIYNVPMSWRGIVMTDDVVRSIQGRGSLDPQPRRQDARFHPAPWTLGNFVEIDRDVAPPTPVPSTVESLGPGSINDLSPDELVTLNDRLWQEEVYTRAEMVDTIPVRTTSRHGDVRMVSVLRQLQDEWNRLVPQAQSQGIPRVRTLNAPLETIQYRRDKLNWLKAQLNSSVDVSSLSFGVEMECLMPVSGIDRAGIAERIRSLGIACEVQDYNHNTSQVWKIVTDGSLGNYVRGIEVVSPVLYGDAGLDEVAKVAEVLKEAKCKITQRCGFHVHVGARNEGVEFFRCLAKLYSSAENVIDQFMAPSRRGSTNTYAQPVRLAPNVDRATNLAEIATAMGQSNHSLRGSGRYKKLNFQSFWQHGTVEFRHHQGTVEAVKIRHWIRLCLLMCAAAKQGKTQALTLDELMDVTKATENEKRYFRDRVAHFNRAIPRSDAFANAGNDLSARSTTRGQI